MVEDLLSEEVLRTLIRYVGRDYIIGACYCRGGVGYIRNRILGFNHAAVGTPIIVLVDLDDLECAPELLRVWLPNGINHNLIFRVAVREVEAWLLADKSAFADFLGLDKKLVPDNPELIDDPKRFVINLAKRSRKSEFRRALVPSEGSTAQVGPDYNGAMSTFVHEFWNPKEACCKSSSLKKTCEILTTFAPIYPAE
ncbi:MAG: DUF4276 family protein [candidate division Zixibacteria bacterium]|nr:DUF4276 family protein [candidate division Zixibacteria bacterium]